jgi:hypothetical protein
MFNSIYIGMGSCFGLLLEFLFVLNVRFFAFTVRSASRFEGKRIDCFKQT